MRRTTAALLPGALLLGSLFAQAQFPEPNGGNLEAGTLPRVWATGGPKCMEMPEWQVHEYNAHLFLLRQSGCTDYEKPFVFLIFGSQRALLLDTGSRNGNLAPEIRLLLHDYMQRNHTESVDLVIAHTHSHGDHVAGDAGLQAMGDAAIHVTFAPPTVEGAKELFKIGQWPEGTGSIDLGERVIDAIPIPGHDAASIALYDRRTGILFTGDSLYPGRIYIRDFAAFAASNARMVKFTEDKPVSYILGNHIEETRTPFLDYPVGTIYQPEEHVLELNRGSLLEVQAAIESFHGKPRRAAYAEFSLWPSGPGMGGNDRAAQDAYRKRQQLQKERMWDQTQPAAPQP